MEYDDSCRRATKGFVALHRCTQWLDARSGLRYNDDTMKTPIVDAHLHVWEMPSERYPWHPLRNMHPAAPASVELLLETMQQHGVDKAIIVQPSNYGYDHAYVADCMARYPGRFGGVALLDFRRPDAAQEVVRLHALGFRGVRLFLYHEADLSWVGQVMPSHHAPTG